MSKPPRVVKLYHITHIDNLASIAREGALLADAVMARRGLEHHKIGMSSIKLRRMTGREVTCHAGTRVGDYVPLYFCPRSVMLYLLHRGNYPGLDYHGGQRPIAHLEFSLASVMRHCQAETIRWAFTDRNAALTYGEFYNDLAQLERVNWGAVLATDWRNAEIKDGKQAEFLVHTALPWSLVERIGVLDAESRAQTLTVLAGAAERPPVQVLPKWYY